MGERGSKDDLGGLLATGVVLALVFFAYPLSLDLPLVDPDEGFHASVAQEMVEQGDWVTPRFLRDPFLDKAVFYFWTEALSLTVLGMSPAAVRLPGMLFALLGMVTTGLVGGRVFNAKVGVVAALTYATMIVPTALAQCPAPDVALVPAINLAILLFWEADRAATRRRAAACTVAIGVLLGLACLTKGLVPVALVGTAYGSYLLLTRRFTLGACLRGATALLVAGLVALPWYLAAESRNPGYLHYFFVERHLLGYATDTQRHGGEPFWYYLPILVAGGLPWVAYLPAGLRDWWTRRKMAQTDRTPSDGELALVLSWLIACTLLLSLAGSKLITYVWPVFPALAILAAVVWVRLLDDRLTNPARRWFSLSFWSLCVSGLPVLPVMLFAAQAEWGVRFSWFVWAVAAAGGSCCCVPLALWHARRYHQALVAGTLVIAGQFVFILAVIAPHAAQVNSARDLAGHFNRLGRLPPRVVVVEERIGSLVFYLDRHLRARLRPGQLESVGAKRMAELSRREPGTVIALAQQRVKKACRYVDLTGLAFQRAGRYRLYSPGQLQPLEPKRSDPHVAAEGRRHAARRLGSSTAGAKRRRSCCCRSSAEGGGCSWRVLR